MQVKIGMIVESEFGCGAVHAYTEQWIIHDDRENGDSNTQYAVNIAENPIWIPIEKPDHVQSSGEQPQISTKQM